MTARPGRADVLVVSLGATGGLRAADAELARSLHRAGASVAVVLRRLDQAGVLVPWSEEALLEAPGTRPGAAVVVPVPVEPSGPVRARDLTAVTYGAHPEKKGLDRLLLAWAAARRPGAELVVAGIERAPVMERFGPLPVAGVRFAGSLAHREYRALLRRARVFATGARREDYGIAQREALADGCQLVTTAAPGPYAALGPALRLDSRLVGDDLATALRTALDDPAPGYAERAALYLEPWRRRAVDRQVADQLLPRLMRGGGVS